MVRGVGEIMGGSSLSPTGPKKMKKEFIYLFEKKYSYLPTPLHIPIYCINFVMDSSWFFSDLLGRAIGTMIVEVSK